MRFQTRLSLLLPLAMTVGCGRTALLENESSGAAGPDGLPHTPGDEHDGNERDAGERSPDPSSAADAAFEGGTSPAALDLRTACLVTRNKVVFIGAGDRNGIPFIDEAPPGAWDIYANGESYGLSRVTAFDSPWSVTLATTALRAPLVVGAYEEVGNSDGPQAPGHAGMYVWWRTDPSCGELTGRFEVLELDAVRTGLKEFKVKSITATFEQRCHDSANTNYRGCVHFTQ